MAGVQGSRIKSITPNAVILGKISIGEGSYIGANSTILPNTKIGSYIIIGAVVTKNITEPNEKYFGIPAKKMIIH